MEYLSVETFGSFITLSLLEIVLGIDNLIFIALVVQNIPKQYRKSARLLGLVLALVIRILMLLGAAWIMQLTEPFVSINNFDLSVKDLLLLGGGIFLIAKSTFEVHNDIAGREEHAAIKARSSFGGAVFQIVMIDFIFSFDSIITAVGMTPHLPIIIAAIVVAMLMMVLASGYISHFLEEYPTFKILALSFILMIGTMLVAEGMHFHMPRGYIYFAFFFSIFVEVLNTYAGKKRKPKHHSMQEIE